MVASLTSARVQRALFAVCALALVAGCGPRAQPQNGYRPGVIPGITRAGVLEILGKPTQEGPFQLASIAADVMTYPFGQVLLQHDRVVAVTIASDPSYVGPYGISLGMQEDPVRKALRADHKRRVGHVDNYELIVGETDTRTRDLYDSTDHLIVEMAAANPNDPYAPFNVISITLGDSAGTALMAAITQAKVSGLYPDEHVDNFISEPWHT